jgi:hypothetical protein
MYIYQGKERRIGTADRRVFPTDTPALGRRMGTGDRRSHRSIPITPTVVEHTPGKTAQEKFDRAKSYNSGNSALLIEYREALIRAYELGKDIKELYGIVPPKAMYNDPKEVQSEHFIISLTVN